MYNNPADKEPCQSRLPQLTSAHEKQFTTIGLTQGLKRFIAHKVNRFSINHYGHATARYMEDTVIEEDENTNPKLTEKFFLKKKYAFAINSMHRKNDNFNSTGL